MFDPKVNKCPICNAIKWAKGPHPTYILSSNTDERASVGGIPVVAYLCDNCGFVALIHDIKN